MYLETKSSCCRGHIDGNWPELYDGAILQKWVDKCLDWTGCKNKKTEEMKDQHGCGIHAKSNKFHRDGRKNLRGTLAKQSRVSMETALWLIAHKYIEKSDNIWPRRVRCHWLRCLKDLQIYEMSVYLLKSVEVFFVSVFQWIKDALIEKHLFMISGTNCDWTTNGVLDCGIIMAGLTLWEPSFNSDSHGLWINLHPQTLGGLGGAHFHPLQAHTHASVSFRIYVYWNASKSDLRVSAWSSEGHSCVGTDEEAFFPCFCPCWYKSSLSLNNITGPLGLRQEMMSLNCLTSYPCV